MLHVELSRKVHYSSGHRYAHPEWSDEKNRDVFGPCFSEHGHGHNYVLEVHVRGPIDKDTGMIINLVDLDKALKEVVNPLDHHHLNKDVPEFKDKVPTTENLSLYCYEKLKKELSPYPELKISKLKLFEGPDLWSEVVDA